MANTIEHSRLQFELQDVVGSGDSNDIMTQLCKCADLCDLPSEIKNECVYNTYTSYIERYTCFSFWGEIEMWESSKKKSKRIREFIEGWAEHIQKFSDFEKAKILKSIISCISIKKCIRYTMYLWSFSNFRKMIQCIDIKSNACGKRIEEECIFSSLFQSHQMSNSERINAVREIIDDTELHDYLISYILRVVMLNQPYTASLKSPNVLYRCSSISFNIFIFELLYEIYKKHNAIENVIADKKVYKVDEFGYTRGENINMELCVALPNAQYIALQCCYYTFPLVHVQEKKYMDIIEFLEKEFVQNTMIDYFKVHQYLGFDSVAVDLADFLEFIYKNKNKFKVTIKNELFEIASSILGSTQFKDPYRFQMYTTIEKICPQVGFDPFKGFLNNLFKFINEVDIEKLDLPFGQQIIHQRSVVTTLQQMIDISSVIENESTYIFAETIFKLISRTLNLFDIFDDELFEKLCNSIHLINNYYRYFNQTLQIITSTLLVYKSIYDKKLINTPYPELEEKYITMIGRILQNLKIKDGANIFKLNCKDAYHSPTINICFDVILDKLNGSAIMEIKEIILDVIDHVELENNDNKKIIRDRLMTHQEETYPEEFVDPISYRNIKNPVMIPGCNVVFERITIVTQIYQHGTHPYTREELSLADLESYNYEKHVIEKISAFVEKRDRYVDQLQKSKESVKEIVKEKSKKNIKEDAKKDVTKEDTNGDTTEDAKEDTKKIPKTKPKKTSKEKAKKNSKKSQRKNNKKSANECPKEN